MPIRPGRSRRPKTSTLAILAGLAAAPNAQTFRWEAGTHNDVTERVERALERARQRVARQVRRLDQQRVREVERSIYASDRYSAQIERQVPTVTRTWPAASTARRITAASP